MIGQTLIDNDYLTLETTSKTMDDNVISYCLKFIVKDNLIVLTGMTKSLLAISVDGINIDNEFSKIRNIGMGGSVAQDQFNSMLNIAELFINSEYEFIAE